MLCGYESRNRETNEQQQRIQAATLISAKGVTNPRFSGSV
jgi:hypothetical protein